jgi:hypothetical protein
MFFKSAVLISLVAATSVHASTILRREFAEAEQYPGFVVLDVQKSGNGTLVWYGDENPPTTSAPTTPRIAAVQNCGDNWPIKCDGNNGALNWVCGLLYDDLTKNADQLLGTSPRSICRNENGNSCCASWADPSDWVYQGSLRPAMDAVRSLHQAKLIVWLWSVN